ncbi:MAG TPA: YetF domain-containing protein [Mycobacteriales bacterium]|jgi:uncharacterized membrane protein YcaP (DUF421 family)|nr:YetF domain-containing protein [Mycobacteriales bacterium]
MWHSMFFLGLPPAEKVLRAVLIYLFLVIALRIAGKRELAQLNTLDFVVLLAVANAVQNGLIGNDNSVTGATLGAAILFLVNGLLAFLLFRKARLRRWVEGTPTVLIRDGKLDEAGLRREEMTHDELLTEVQSAGADTFEEVESAMLEPSGKVVVVPKRPDESTRQYQDLIRRLDELTALVQARETPGPQVS